MQLSLQGPSPTTADGWKPLFRIKTALSFPLLLIIKILTKKKKKTTPALPREENPYLTVFFFHTAWPYNSAFGPHCCDICPFVVSKSRPTKRWQNVTRGERSPSTFILNRKHLDLNLKGKRFITESQQDRGDWNVNWPATCFTTPPS